MARIALQILRQTEHADAMIKYLHSMIRVTDPVASVHFFELLGLKEVRRKDSESGRFTLIFLAAPGPVSYTHLTLPTICSV